MGAPRTLRSAHAAQTIPESFALKLGLDYARLDQLDTANHPANTTDQAWWLVLESGGKPCQVRLHQAVTMVGRDESCDVRIPASTVSKFHCQIELQGEKLHVRDLHSRNGTFHNEQRIQNNLVNSGDQIAVGPVTFRVFAIQKRHTPLAGPKGNDETLVAWTDHP